MNTNKWGLIATILTLLGLGFAAMSANPPFYVPNWVPIAFFVAAGLVILWLIIALVASRRLEKVSIIPLVLTPHTYAIGLSGMTGYPDEPENAAWLLLEVFVNAIDKPIDTLDLIIDGKTIPANHWHGKNVTAFNVYFNVTEWQWKGKNQVELIAHVGDKMQRSGRITIDFNVEPWGSHRI